MQTVSVAAVQMHCEDLKDIQNNGISANIAIADKYVREAAAQGANIILLPELFETKYFCQERNYDYYKLATTVADNAAINHFQIVAKELHVVLPISFYERSGNAFFNSIAILDADGSLLGVYRKSHIPDDHYYQEKFYFTPGDTGFQVWDTAFGRIGVGICWDQWFPEAARCMALEGAQLLFYPTAIGSEPILSCDSMPHWRRVMQGHSAANVIPVIAANRIGVESIVPNEENGGQTSSLTFYGSSFITNETGEVIASLDDRNKEGVLLASFDLDAIDEMRASWGLFRDRRPELYKRLEQY